MQGPDIFRVLKQIGATHLYHANSVTTGCTFLEEGGIASRGFVEDNGLKQTPQASDQIDKKYGIWHHIFLDHVDIHGRAGQKKGPNQYGPVLFVFSLGILLGLPPSTEILVTKKNPIFWHDNDSESDRWFQSVHELRKHIQLGDFNKMLVIETPSEKLNFPDRRARIRLDDPQRNVSSGENAYTHAKDRLTAAAVGRVEVYIERRKCPIDCICVKEYTKYTKNEMDVDFS